MASKWKKRYMQIRESSMCRNVWAYLNVEPDGTVRLMYRHDCGDECPFLKEVRDE